MISEADAYKAVDFKKIYTTANEFLATSRTITGFPFKVKDFVYEQSDIKLCSFKKAKEQYGLSMKTFGSESAVIQEFNGANIVFYNQDEYAPRVRYSITHEFAHYIFSHKMNLEQTDSLYHTQELESNCFAAQLLMPEQILRECIRRHQNLSIDFIQNAFSVSKEAAEKRKLTLSRTDYDWKSRAEKEYDDIILMRFSDMIDTIAPEPPTSWAYDFESDYERQFERQSWLDTRSRWE